MWSISDTDVNIILFKILKIPLSGFQAVNNYKQQEGKQKNNEKSSKIRTKKKIK